MDDSKNLVMIICTLLLGKTHSSVSLGYSSNKHFDIRLTSTTQRLYSTQYRTNWHFYGLFAKKLVSEKTTLFAKKILLAKGPSFSNDGLMKRLLGKVGRCCSNPRQDTRSRRTVLCETKSYWIYWVMKKTLMKLKDYLLDTKSQVTTIRTRQGTSFMSTL